ncbi:hypothetical protein [Burkholderia oklahomensis]|uniref:hypothetical protein n=1 Tax=Burkholderia oklahomensis TaxID=342113 RepID=UPI000ADA004C|nr:hypothetical protein [Burkholderia oklahomensis]MBI0361372.1 hypothetical protein [Burkholderia oklahomensis]
MRGGDSAAVRSRRAVPPDFLISRPRCRDASIARRRIGVLGFGPGRAPGAGVKSNASPLPDGWPDAVIEPPSQPRPFGAPIPAAAAPRPVLRMAAAAAPPVVFLSARSPNKPLNARIGVA